MSESLPFETPPFDPGKFGPKEQFCWWGWNPNYPYWSKTCWSADNEEAARTIHGREHLSPYATALVREYMGVFTVLEQWPPLDEAAWHRIAANRAKETKP